ncbi:MAG: DNRLRE domain-containing protein [Anaerolineales bacterium]
MLKITQYTAILPIIFFPFLTGLSHLSKSKINDFTYFKMESANQYLPVETDNEHYLFLPVLMSPHRKSPQVNVPYFENEIRYPETAISWFGRVTPIENYVDMRLGYNDHELFVHVTIFDRRLWYDISPSVESLTDWDAITLYLDLAGGKGESPSMLTYRFVAQLNWWEQRDNWQAAYRGNGQGWQIANISFTSNSGWRGNAPNDDVDDRGWTMGFRIPFESLGLSETPPTGSVWGLALSLHDRDDSAGTPIADKYWPASADTLKPNSWGRIHFGLPVYSTPPVEPDGTVIIRHGLDGIQVVDVHVGGSFNCGDPFAPTFFDGWGDANYAGSSQVNVQNQSDVADWPCFSKYFLTFPLDSIPPGKVILSAALKLHLFGNSGQGWQPEPQPSLIQVLTVEENWDESTITWNNAPPAFENIARTWVYPVDEFPGWPGIPYEWDVSAAVSQAYNNGELLRLVVYSADAAIHSGKYFVSSDTEEWNAAARPTLELVWGQP